jgi:hypothetical protein
METGKRKMDKRAWLLAVALAIFQFPFSIFLAPAQQPVPPRDLVVDFEGDSVGSKPEGFSCGLTGQGAPGSWQVREDPTAPAGHKVLAQVSTDATSYRFPLCVYDLLTAKDVEVTAKFKAISGKVDQAAGLVARFQDANNYYIVRANALENNVRLYRVVAGRRQQFAGADVSVSSGQWHSLALQVRGTRFKVSFNQKLLFEADDATLPGAGKAGLWTKADSVTHFDQLVITSLDAK